MRVRAIGESDPLARLVGEERRVGRQGVGRMAGARDEGRDNREDGVWGWRMEWGQDLMGCFRSHFGSSQHQFFPDFTWYGTVTMGHTRALVTIRTVGGSMVHTNSQLASEFLQLLSGVKTFRDAKVCNNLATDELTITKYSLTTSA